MVLVTPLERAVCYALARCHYTRDIQRPKDDYVVKVNVEVNWRSFLRMARAAIEAYEQAHEPEPHPEPPAQGT